MNNWPNPNTPGEPKFPEIARTHFLSYTAEKSVYENLPEYVKQDTLLVGVWSPPNRRWLFMTGDILTAEQAAAEVRYISPCYTEEEMRQAQIGAVNGCMQICEEAANGGFVEDASPILFCLDQIEIYKESI